MKWVHTRHSRDEAEFDEVTDAEIEFVLSNGIRIETYPERGAALLCGAVNGRVIHVVADWPFLSQMYEDAPPITVRTMYDPSRDKEQRFLPPQYDKRR